MTVLTKQPWTIKRQYETKGKNIYIKFGKFQSLLADASND